MAKGGGWMLVDTIASPGGVEGDDAREKIFNTNGITFFLKLHYRGF